MHPFCKSVFLVCPVSLATEGGRGSTHGPKSFRLMKLLTVDTQSEKLQTHYLCFATVAVVCLAHASVSRVARAV